MKISTVITLLSSVGAAAAKNPTFVVPKSHASAQMIAIRGGAGPLDPEVLAKVSTASCLAQGLFGTLGPKQANEAYGLSEELNDSVQQYHNKMLNTGILSIGIISYYLFFKGESIQKAVKVSNVLWAYEMTRNILSGDATAGGYSDLNMAKLTVAIFIFAAFAMTQDYADTVIKVTSVLWGATGAHCYLAPESAKSLWNLTEGPAERTSDNCCEFGVFLLSYSILTGSLVFCEDVTALKALAYATVPWFLNNIKYFIDGKFDKYGLEKVPFALWTLFHLAVMGTILL